jgi:hypothetical protein
MKHYTILYQYRKGEERHSIFTADAVAATVADALIKTELTNEEMYNIWGVFDEETNLFRRINN